MLTREPYTVGSNSQALRGILALRESTRVVLPLVGTLTPKEGAYALDILKLASSRQMVKWDPVS